MMRHIRLIVLTSLLFTPLSARAATVVQELGDASVARDSRAGTWTIGAGGATLTVALDPSRDFQVVGLVSPSGRNWLVNGTAGTALTLEGSLLAFGSTAGGFQYENVTTSNDGHVLRLDAAFLVRSADLRVVRHFAVTDGSPTFETWTTFESLGPSLSLSNLNAFQFSVPVGTIHWLNGLQGDNADTVHDTAFTLQQQDLPVGQTLVLGAQRRSSEQTVPWFAIDGVQDEFYAGLMWSGAWSLTIDRSSVGLSLSFGLAAMTTTLAGATVDGPHAVFGVVAGRLPQASSALRLYVVQGIREGRGFSPLVTFNTWFAHGTSIDESSMRAEMAGAASLGTELFVIDAGWYSGAGAGGPFDFDSGLGSWKVDSTRFPNGLKPLTDYAHSLGMKVGIWVEPERVNLSTVGAPGAEESWLATSGDSYGSADAAQICLATAAGRQWVINQLTALIDAVQPDYVKWDNNMWINCDRPGHGHGSTDGNFAHVTGLYQVLAALRERYPDLLIENVSGGGNRLDFGMVRYTDVAWMDDRTAPSVHVRHNLEGLSTAFPPAYLLSFVTNQAGEPLHDAPDLSLYFRSRMGGALGLCFLTRDLSQDDRALIGREIAIYKNVRATLSVAAGALLTSQAAIDDGPVWDVLQATAPEGEAIVVFAYQSDDGTETLNVKPITLQPDATYVVESVDTGALGTAVGADLMANGIEIVKSPNTAAHMLTLVAGQ